MQHSFFNLFALALAASQASAEIIKVEVGKGGLSFEPNTIKASKGDVVEFHFDSQHSVVAGDFSKPCSPASSGGFGSGVLPSGDKSYFSINVTDTKPVFFYCGVPGHCQAGMVGVINEGSDKLSAYESAAAKTDETTNPPKAFGGVISSKADSGSSSSSSAATTTGESSETGTTTGSSAAATTSDSFAPRLSGSIVGAMGLSLVIGGVLAA